MTGDKGISTGELWARLFKAPSIGAYLDENSGTTLPTFADYIAQLSDERSLKHEAVIARAGLERSFGHRLFNGMRKPSRDTVLQLAFGLGLDCDGAQQLLKVAGASALHPKVKRDAVIAYCLHNGCSLMDAQELLYENALPLLGGAKHE
ncbi:MAG: XRE family transcriptional regulator [Eggerthellaceae bacterium]|nr:XRE family transcriptional regulator [Eggerthellaceae bacterium]